MNSTPSSTVSAPIATQRAFSRPAALIGGAVGLVALTAVATTLALRSPASTGADARGAPATPVLALSTPMAQGRSAAAPEAPADFPETMAPPATPRTAPVARTAKAPAPNHVQRGSVKADDAGARTASTCAACGKVEAVDAVQKKGEGSGLGVVGGAVVGGLVGSQIGGGNGKNAMAVLGAVGGGVAGNEIEKRARATTVYQVRVRMDDGTLRTVTQNTAPAIGQKVVVEGATLRPQTPSS